MDCRLKANAAQEILSHELKFNVEMTSFEDIATQA